MNKITKLSFFSGLLVLIFGFIVMLILWNTIGRQYHSMELRGFFYYRAATIGDGLCLPVLTGSAVYFILTTNKISKNQNKICIFYGIAAVIIGFGIQAKWLISDDTVLNWTIPTQHCFNFAGWYHSLFFISMCGLLFYLLSYMWFTIKNNMEKYGIKQKISYVLFMFAGSMYIIIYLTDNYSQLIQRNVLYIGELITIIIIFGIYLLTTNNKSYIQLIAPMLMGCVASSLFALIINFYL